MELPKKFQRHVGKQELRYFSKAVYLGVAKSKARFLTGQVQLIFNSSRRSNTVFSSLSGDQIQKLVQQYTKNSIDICDRDFYEEWDGEHPSSLFVDAATFHSCLEKLDDIGEDLIADA